MDKPHSNPPYRPNRQSGPFFICWPSGVLDFKSVFSGTKRGTSSFCKRIAIRSSKTGKSEKKEFKTRATRVQFFGPRPTRLAETRLANVVPVAAEIAIANPSHWQPSKL